MNDESISCSKNELNFCDSTLQRLDRLINQTRHQVDTIETFLDRFGIEFRKDPGPESIKQNDAKEPYLKELIGSGFSQLESLNDRLDHALNFLNKIA
jgi:hypothetical protein